MDRRYALKRIISFCTIFLGLLIFGMSVHQDRLRAQTESLSLSLVKGQQYELCRSLEETFNAVFIQSEEDFWCKTSEILEPPLFPQPTWNDVDISADRKLAREIFLRGWLGHWFRDGAIVDDFWERRKDRFKEELSQGKINVQSSNFDLNFDGDPDLVYRYSRADCTLETGDEIPSAWSYHVLDRDNPILSENILFYSRSTLDSFFFRGRTYLLGLITGGALIYEPNNVPEIESLAMLPVCEFKWNGDEL
ncbi:hypothetical protein [Synechococcus sp. PCC 7336]|uniref:hypothetical protein n=1 Tax=Synechococcus sp. PCC 7336 TaxID=195250 RepID=UPI000376BCD9|nr:hypothetical protein [Synechococcus sp. PCC 7336]